MTAENVQWSGHCGKQHGDSSKQLTIEFIYDPAIPLLGIDPKELKAGIRTDYLYTPVHSRIIYNILKVEATHVPINE